MEASQRYQSGFNECAREVTRYLTSTPSVKPDVQIRMLNHLANKAHNVNTTSSPHHQSSEESICVPLKVEIPTNQTFLTYRESDTMSHVPNTTCYNDRYTTILNNMNRNYIHTPNNVRTTNSNCQNNFNSNMISKRPSANKPYARKPLNTIEHDSAIKLYTTGHKSDAMVPSIDNPQKNNIDGLVQQTNDDKAWRPW